MSPPYLYSDRLMITFIADEVKFTMLGAAPMLIIAQMICHSDGIYRA